MSNLKPYFREDLVNILAGIYKTVYELSTGQFLDGALFVINTLLTIIGSSQEELKEVYQKNQGNNDVRR